MKYRLGHEYHPITPGLWQGAQPPEGRFLREQGFDALVLCAVEYQPPAERFPGLVEVVYAPNDDDLRPPTEVEFGGARIAALRVVQHVMHDHNVLVTCHMGINRSGLVAALALHLLTRESGAACAAVVQAMRPGALRNPHFVAALSALPARNRGRQVR